VTMKQAAQYKCLTIPETTKNV